MSSNTSNTSNTSGREVSPKSFEYFRHVYPAREGNKFSIEGFTGDTVQRISLWVDGHTRTTEEALAALPTFVREDPNLRYAILDGMFLLVNVRDPAAPLPVPEVLNRDNCS